MIDPLHAAHAHDAFERDASVRPADVVVDWFVLTRRGHRDRPAHPLRLPTHLLIFTEKQCTQPACAPQVSWLGCAHRGLLTLLGALLLLLLLFLVWRSSRAHRAAQAPREEERGRTVCEWRTRRARPQRTAQVAVLVQLFNHRVASKPWHSSIAAQHSSVLFPHRYYGLSMDTTYTTKLVWTTALIYRKCSLERDSVVTGSGLTTPKRRIGPPTKNEEPIANNRQLSGEAALCLCFIFI
eukprot:scaffold51929_cov31-Tisochrysis_lutea.AAC.1